MRAHSIGPVGNEIYAALTNGSRRPEDAGFLDKRDAQDPCGIRTKARERRILAADYLA